jgi:hypothetical protein
VFGRNFGGGGGGNSFGGGRFGRNAGGLLGSFLGGGNLLRTGCLVVAGLAVVCVLCVVLSGGALGSLVSGIFGGGGGGSAAGGTGGIRNTADAVAEGFMQALSDGDYETAYNLMSPDLQNDFGNSVTEFANGARSVARPTRWNLQSFNSDQGAEFAGTVDFDNNVTGDARLEVVNTVDGWRVDAFNLNS